MSEGVVVDDDEDDEASIELLLDVDLLSGECWLLLLAFGVTRDDGDCAVFDEPAAIEFIPSVSGWLSGVLLDDEAGETGV